MYQSTHLGFVTVLLNAVFSICEDINGEAKPLHTGLPQDWTGYNCKQVIDGWKPVCDGDLVSDVKNDEKLVSGTGYWYWYWM